MSPVRRSPVSRRRVLLLTSAALLTAVISPLPAQVRSWKDVVSPPLKPFEIPSPQRKTLPNGLAIFLMEDHELPLIHVNVLVRTGERDMPAGKAGMGQIFGEAWRTGGTASRSGDALDDLLETRAAKVETSMREDSAAVELDCLTADFSEVLGVLAELLREPAFAEDKIEIARNSVKTQIARRNDSPSEIVFREGTKLGYGADSPYARVPEYATVAAVTRQNLLDWHHKYVIPNRILIGVHGNFDSKEMLATLTRTFGTWPKGPEFKDPSPSYQKQTKPAYYFIEKKDVTKASVQLIHLGTRRDDPQYYAIEVLNEIFGEGFSSRLFSNVRTTKGLAYSVFGSVGTGYDHPGLFRIHLDTKNSTVAAGIDALFEEVDGITGKRPITEAELKRAKDSIVNSFVFRFDSKEKVLYQQMTYAYFGYPPDFLQRYRAGIEKVTLDDVAGAARDFIHHDRMAVLVVGKSSEFDRPLSSFGPVTPVDISIPLPEEPKRAAATSESRDRGRELFGRVVAGMGGKEKLASLRDLLVTGTVATKTSMGEMSLKVRRAILLPDRLQQEVQTPMGTMVMSVSPAGAFVSAGGQTQPLPDSAREQLTGELRRDPLLIARRAGDPALVVSHAGSDKVGEVPVELLDVTNEGASVRFFVDAASGRILRASYRSMGPQGPADAVMDYSDFRQVDGLWLAYAEKVSVGGQERSVAIQEWKINSGLDPAIFEAPAAERPAGAAGG